MKTIYLKWLITPFCGVILGIFSLCAQQTKEAFSTQFFFEGANGKKDTLVFGYDLRASYGSDPIYGEVERCEPDRSDTSSLGVYYSMTQLYHSIYRSGDYSYISYQPLSQRGLYMGRDDYENSISIYFKKQIVPIAQKFDLSNFSIIIPEESLPVRVSWDQNLFLDSERVNSVLSNLSPFFWKREEALFEYSFLVNLKDTSQQEINIQPEGLNYDYYASYYDSVNEKTYKYYVIYLSFFSGKVFSVLNEKDACLSNDKLVLYPNPVQNMLYWKTEAKIKKWRIYNVLGVIISKGNGEITECNTSFYPQGVYIWEGDVEGGSKMNKKFIKQ